MNILPTTRRLLTVTLLGTAFAGGTAWAHAGEDHGAPAAATPQAVLPRASAATDDFELVAVLEGTRLLIHVDRAASNEPVLGARVEIEGAGPAAVAAEVAPGVYALELSRPLAAGAHPLTFTIEAGAGDDLVAATLEVPAKGVPSSANVSANAMPDSSRRGWPWVAGGAGLAGTGFVWLALRRRRAAAAR